MQILPPRKPSFGAAFYADRRRRMPLEKPAAVAADPVDSRVAALGIIPARGEQSNQVETDRLYLESSPRVRGTAGADGPADSGRGITPARAGSSGRSHLPPSAAWDHPRVCGEQASLPITPPVL